MNFLELNMKNNPPSDTSRPFDIAVWKRASAKKRRGREHLRLNALDNVWKAVGQLRNKYKWDELYLFGSVTKPEKFSEHSDIDIGIQGLENVLHYRFIADLSELLEWGIDVVRLEDCSFAEAIKMRGIQWKRSK